MDKQTGRGDSAGTGDVGLPGPRAQGCGLGWPVCTAPAQTLHPIPQAPEPREEGSAHLAVPGVYFTCPLTGATLRKDQRDARIREAILSVSPWPLPPPSRPGRVVLRLPSLWACPL